MMGLLVPGICANVLCVYARTMKYNQYEMQIAPLYEKELSRYKRFFHDEDFTYFESNMESAKHIISHVGYFFTES